MSDLESIDHSSSTCSLEDKLPTTNNLLRGKEGQYAVGRKIAQGRHGAVFEVPLLELVMKGNRSSEKLMENNLLWSWKCVKLTPTGWIWTTLLWTRRLVTVSTHFFFRRNLWLSFRMQSSLEDDRSGKNRRSLQVYYHTSRELIPERTIRVCFQLGDNLMKLRHMFVDGRFSLSSGLRLGLLTLASIQELHGVGFVHRDIKVSLYSTYKGDIFSPQTSVSSPIILKTTWS